MGGAWEALPGVGTVSSGMMFTNKNGRGPGGPFLGGATVISRMMFTNKNGRALGGLPWGGQ